MQHRLLRAAALVGGGARPTRLIGEKVQGSTPQLLCHAPKVVGPARRRSTVAGDQHAGLRPLRFIQRFDSALRLNPHAHTLALDGVYVRTGDGELTFHELPTPTAAEVTDVARRTADGVRRLLEAREGEGHEDEPTDWQVCCAASARGLSLFGDRAGQPPLRLVDPRCRLMPAP